MTIHDAKVAIFECSAQNESSARCNSTLTCVQPLRERHAGAYFSARPANPGPRAYSVTQFAARVAFAGFWGRWAGQRV